MFVFLWQSCPLACRLCYAFLWNALNIKGFMYFYQIKSRSRKRNILCCWWLGHSQMTTLKNRWSTQFWVIWAWFPQFWVNPQIWAITQNWWNHAQITQNWVLHLFLRVVIYLIVSGMVHDFRYKCQLSYCQLCYCQLCYCQRCYTAFRGSTGPLESCSDL